MFLLQIE